MSRAIEARKNADPAQLMVFKPRVTGSNPAAQKVQYRKCPECEAFMHRRNFRKSSGVIIDRCAVHGTWLDADELEQIAGFILSGRAAGGVADRTTERTRTGPAHRGRRHVQALRTHRTPGWRDGVVGSVVDVLFAILK